MFFFLIRAHGAAAEPVNIPLDRLYWKTSPTGIPARSNSEEENRWNSMKRLKPLAGTKKYVSFIEDLVLHNVTSINYYLRFSDTSRGQQGSSDTPAANAARHPCGHLLGRAGCHCGASEFIGYRMGNPCDGHREQ